MWCYRRFGHNEGDEPSFTQPLMYDAIRKHPSVSAIYADRLASESVVDKTMTDEMIERFVKHPDEEFEAGKASLPKKTHWFGGRWTGRGKPADPETDGPARATGVPEAAVEQDEIGSRSRRESEGA